MWRLKITTILALLLVTGLLVSCGSQVSDQPSPGPTATPRTATDKDIELLKEIFQTNASQVKSYHQVVEIRGDLYSEPGKEPPVTRLETDVAAPGRTHTWGQYLGKPSESYVLSGTAYMKDTAGNWAEQEASSSVLEIVKGPLTIANLDSLNEADWIRVLDPSEKINGVVTQQFVWEKHETIGWFTGSTFTHSVWVDPQTKFAQKAESCLWIIVPTATATGTATGTATAVSSISTTPDVEQGVRKESCTTTTYSRHNEQVSIGTPPITGPTPTPLTGMDLMVTKPVCGSWNVRRWPVDEWAAVREGHGFEAVDSSSPDNVWVASPKMADKNGGGGLIPSVARWDGKEWSLFQVSALGENWVADTFHDIAALSKDDVWVVGNANRGVRGSDTFESMRTLIVHWDGREWKRIASPSPGVDFNYLTAAEGIAADDVWIGGSWTTMHGEYDKDSENGAFALHWDGHSLSAVDLPGMTNLSDIAASSSADVWMVGNTTMHWDSKEWRQEALPPGIFVDALAAISPDDAWALGTAYVDPTSESKEEKTVSLHWDGKEWREVVLPLGPKSTLKSISAAEPNNVWAVGEQYVTASNRQAHYEALVMHWNGKDWQRVDFPRLEANQHLDGVSLAGEGEVWAVGEAEAQGQVGFSEPSGGLLAHFTSEGCVK